MAAQLKFINVLERRGVRFVVACTISSSPAPISSMESRYSKVGYVRRHGMTGFMKKEGYLPHFGVGQDVLERRHACKADAILHFPERYSRRIGAYAHNSVHIFDPELRSSRIHRLCQVTSTAGCPLAYRAVLDKDMVT